MSSDSDPDCYGYYHEYEDYCEYEEIEKSLWNNNTELLNETLNRDSDTVKWIQSDNNETLLHLSAQFGCIEAAKRLIEQHGIDVNTRDYDEKTPLFKATMCKSAEMFKFLLRNGADISITANHGPNFLQAALIWSPIETVELVVQKLHVDYENQGDSEVTDDIQKCENIVKFLLNKKIDAMFPNSKFSLLLLFVLKFGDEKSFKLVLQTDKHFHIDALNPINENPMLHHAIRLGKFPHVNLLFDHGANIHVNGYDKQTCLHLAVAANNLELVHYLLQHGVNVNAATNNNKFTPLHYAVAVGNKEIVESLINAGANLQAEFLNSVRLFNWQNSSVLNIVSGRTKLNTLSSGIIHIDSYDPNVIFDIDMIQFLLERGAKTEVKDYSIKGCGFTPLERACQAGRMDVLQILANYGAHFHSLSDNGSTMLHHAVIGGNFEIIDLLLRMNLDINAKNYRGQPPLYHAIHNNSKINAVPLIEFIVDNGANVDLCLPQGYSSKLPDVVECLLELNDNFKFKYSQGNWSLPIVIDYFAETTLSRKLLIAFMAATEIDINYGYIQRGKREFVDRFYEECKLEVLRMKNVKFREDKLISLFDFLTNDLMRVTNFSVIDKIIDNLESSDLVREYPHYAFLLEKRMGRVKTILYFKQAIADFLEKYAMLKLPIDVVDYIFSYLSVAHIRNFARALPVTKKES
ncbi:alpha-latroinsectotoxin-Lt1a-like [Belonocnema kinseyi]|uniref:alpha-latroinsectotoxin-Lt1a-like n=1 Tax=Belonocnema kinseyi TaxID=2817044 RepID=UPI00143D5C85|nr:alpha-latroinsectotoxin-Lt1a-like [Belonocnema kinseyi]